MTDETPAPDLESAKKVVHDVQRDGITADEVDSFYDKWYSSYDQDMATCGYGHRQAIAAAAIEKEIPNKSARILDVAAGTGLLAEELKKVGYTNIDALDANAMMLEVAKKKGLYQKFICAFLGPSELDIERDSYDLVTVLGGFAEGHLKEDCLEELMRIVKPGGCIMTIIPEVTLEKSKYLRNLEPKMQELHDQKKWTWVGRNKIGNYIPDGSGNGIVFIFRVL